MTREDDSHGLSIECRAYRLYGLTVASPIALPEAMPCPTSCEPERSDVVIREGAVPTTLDNPEKRHDYWEARKGDFLLHIPGLARFRVQSGTEVTFERHPAASDDELRAYLLGSCLGAILHQRGVAALHAAGLVCDGHAFLICGRSGAGKSTTAAHLQAKRGAAMLCDDLAAIEPSSALRVQPGLFRTRLDAAALTSLGRKPSGAPGVKDKWAISVADAFVDRPQRLAGVLVVERHLDAEGMTLRRLAPPGALQALRKHAYRRNFTTHDRAQQILDVWARVAGSVPVWHVARPLGQDTMSQLAELAERAFATALAERGDLVA